MSSEDLHRLLLDKFGNYLVAIAVAITFVLWGKLRQAVIAAITRHPPIEFTRRELLVVVAACSIFCFFLNAAMLLPVFVKPDNVPDPSPTVAWIFIAGAALSGLFVCWAVLRTPKEKQPGILRYVAVMAVIATAVTLAMSGYFAVGQPSGIKEVMGKLPAIIILVGLLFASLLSIRRIKKELRAGAIKPFSWGLPYIVHAVTIGLCIPLSLVIFLVWYLQVPQAPAPNWLNWIVKIGWPVSLWPVFVLWKNARKYAGETKVSGYVAAIAVLLCVCIVGIFGTRLPQKEKPSASVIAEAKMHPGFVIMEIDGTYERANIPFQAIKGFWEVDKDGHIKGDFHRNPKYVAQHKTPDGNASILVSFPPQDSGATRPIRADAGEREP